MAASNPLRADRKALLLIPQSPGQVIDRSIELKRDLVRWSRLELTVITCWVSLARWVMI